MATQLKDLSKTKKIMLLKQLMVELKVLVACDEEWNTLFTKFEIQIDSNSKRPVIFGLSGSELEETFTGCEDWRDEQ